MTDKMQIMLAEEEKARKELFDTITCILECKIPQEQFTMTVEQILLATKDYLGAIRDLSALLKQDYSDVLKPYYPDTKCPKCNQSNYILAHICKCGHTY
jgi:hypothetical protein